MMIADRETAYAFKRTLKALNQRPIAYYPIYGKIMESAAGGIFLSQILYWWSVVEGDEFYKTDAELMKETLLSEWEIRQSKKKAAEKGIIEVIRKGMPAKTYYKINYNNLLDKINSVQRNSHPSSEESTEQEARNPRNKKRGIHGPNYTETTTETTTGEEGGILPKNPGKGKKPRPYPTNGSSTSPPPTDKGFSGNTAGGARTPTSPVTDEMLADVVSDTRDGPPKINKSLTEIANKEHRIVALVEFVRDLYTNKLGYAHPDWIMPPYSTQYYQKLSALCEDDGMAAKLCQTVEWIAKCNPKHDMSMLEFVKAIEDRAYSFQEKKKPYDIKRVQGSFLERKQHQKNAAEARPSYGMITG